MFGWLIGTSLRFRFLLMAASAALLVFGSQQLRTMDVDVFPEFAPPKVEIQTIALGMSAEEVEQFVTIPLEDHLRSTPGLDVLRSKSVPGLSDIVLLFKLGEDVIEARRRVQELLDLAITEIPASFGKPQMLQPLSATSRVMKIGIRSDTMDIKDLSMVAYWTMRFRLMKVPGVANIPIWGEQIKLLQVSVDPTRMAAHDVSFDEVLEGTSNALDFGLLPHTSAGKTRIDGMFDTPNQRLAIHLEHPLYTPKTLGKVPLEVARDGPGGEPLVMSDIGNVEWGTWPLMGDAVIDDGRGLMMIVEKLPWANTLEVTRGIEETIEQLRPGLPGIEIDTQIFRPATFIELSLDNLTTAMALGAVLVIIILFAFLYEWRVALISVIAIPLSLVAAGVVLWYQGGTINVMVLAGFIVALGSVVDDAIIDVENIVRRLRQTRKAGSRLSTARVVLDASMEVRPAILHATIIIVLAVTPVFFMGGLSGSFFEPLAYAFLLAMLASMIVATTVTPALCFILLDKAHGFEHRESPLVPWLKRHYVAILRSVIGAPKATIAATLVFVVCGVGIYPLLGQSLLPEFKERDFLMHWIPPQGTSHPEMFRITKAASVELRQIPGVRNFGAHIGNAAQGDEPYGIEFTENWVSLDPEVSYDETRAAIEEAVEGYPGMRRDVQTYLKERIREVLTGSSDAMVVRIFGPDLKELDEIADEVFEAVRYIPGLIDTHISAQKFIPQMQVKVKLEAAARHGVKPGEVRRIVSAYIAGQEVSDMHREGKVYDVYVWSSPEIRGSLDDIAELLIDTPYGGRVRLGEIAEVSMVPTPATVYRENFSRRIDVEGNVRGRDLGSVARDVQAALEPLKFPIGYHAELLGEYKERQRAQQGLFYATTVVAIAIFLILQASFRNWWLASLIYLALPAALVGGILAVYFGDGILSLGALVGIITVLGIAARSGILLIQHYRHIEDVEGEAFGLELVLRGASERLAPILMTTLCTAFALLPLIVAGPIPGHEIEHPMAVVILGGLVTSTLLTLLIVPSLYLRFGAKRQETVDELLQQSSST